MIYLWKVCWIQRTIVEQPTNFESFDKSYRKSSQDNLIDKSEYESLSNIFTKYLDETRNESFF